MSMNRNEVTNNRKRQSTKINVTGDSSVRWRDNVRPRQFGHWLIGRLWVSGARRTSGVTLLIPIIGVYGTRFTSISRTFLVWIAVAVVGIGAKVRRRAEERRTVAVSGSERTESTTSRAASWAWSVTAVACLTLRTLFKNATHTDLYVATRTSRCRSLGRAAGIGAISAKKCYGTHRGVDGVTEPIQMWHIYSVRQITK